MKKIECAGSALPCRGLIVRVLMEKFDGVGTSIRTEGLGVGGGGKGLVVGCNFFWDPDATRVGCRRVGG